MKHSLFLPRDAMRNAVFAVASCSSVCLSRLWQTDRRTYPDGWKYRQTSFTAQ